MESRQRIAHSISKHGVTVLTLLCMSCLKLPSNPGGSMADRSDGWSWSLAGRRMSCSGEGAWAAGSPSSRRPLSR